MSTLALVVPGDLPVTSLKPVIDAIDYVAWKTGCDITRKGQTYYLDHKPKVVPIDGMHWQLSEADPRPAA